jgi:hypothetical protein
VVTVKAEGLSLKRLVQGGSSYISQDDKRLHFGLGAAAVADALEVRWPDGATSRMTNVKADRIIEVSEPR